MAGRPRVALVGDYSPEVTAHRAISLALAGTGLPVEWEWLPTEAVETSDLRRFAGVWLVPASPYRSLAGALTAVRWARSEKVPFLGTCGGFQHALLEFARNVAGLPVAEHAELNPDADVQLVSPLACSLVEQTGSVTLRAGSRLAEAYGETEITEGYHCRYGFNRQFATAVAAAGMEFTAWDGAGDIRAFELSGHPFFVGTLFQSERRALRGEPVPLATAFLKAAIDRSGQTVGS